MILKSAKFNLMTLLRCFVVLWVAGCGNSPELNTSRNDVQKQVIPPDKTSIRFLAQRIEQEYISVDSLMKGEFVFINTGNSNLIIEYVNPDCTCSNYNLSSHLIIPGDTGKINIEVESNGLNGPKKVHSIMAANTEEKFYKLSLSGEFVE